MHLYQVRVSTSDLVFIFWNSVFRLLLAASHGRCADTEMDCHCHKLPSPKLTRIFFLFPVLGFELMFARQVLYHFSHVPSPLA
jgi:hypothetical protein